jgi:hypothetical protein
MLPEHRSRRAPGDSSNTSLADASSNSSLGLMRGGGGVDVRTVPYNVAQDEEGTVIRWKGQDVICWAARLRRLSGLSASHVPMLLDLWR